MRIAKKKQNDGWIEARRRSSKGGSKDSSLKSSNSTTSQSSGKQVEKMKKIIREEGRNARNLLYWRYPNDTKPNDKNNNLERQIYGRSKSETRISITESSRGRTPRKDEKTEKKVNPDSIRAKYWTYLFDNLQSAFDKIFSLCEDESLIDGCKETVIMIDKFRHEFEELRKLLQLKVSGNFDKSVDKKRGIAFELRKTSPAGPAPRKVDQDFKSKTPQKTPRGENLPGSWAERVRSASKDGSGDDSSPIVPRLELGEINVEEIEIPKEPKTPTTEDDWGDLMCQFDKSTIREPGRLATVHEKLMSPSRKKNSEIRPENVRAQIEMKQKEAAQRREDIQRNKAQRVRQTTKKIENAQKIKESEKKTQRERLKEKHKRAEEQRTSKHLGVKLKAKDESQKVREVNFIQGLEQDIKRCESVKKIQKYESQTKKHATTIEEQKELKARENEMKELAVIDRKKKLECKRQTWVNELNLKRTERNSAINQKFEDEKNAKLMLAREKEQKRERIIQVKRQDEQKSIEESKNKIRLKQQEAERRRQEELEKKKEKAAELAGFGQMSPRSLERQAATSNPALSSVVSRKLCFNSDREEEEKENIITQSPKKVNKKKTKKIRSRLNSRRENFEEALNGSKPPVPSKGKIGKLVGDIGRNAALQSRENKDSIWPNNRQMAVDRSLVELTRMNGSSNLGDIIPLTIALQDLLHFPKLPTKTIKNIAELWRRFRPIASASLLCSSVPHCVIDMILSDVKEFLYDAQSNSVYHPEKWLLLDSFSLLMIQSDEAPTGSDLAHQACLDTVSYCLINEVYDRFAECHSLEAANFGALPCAVFAFLTASIRTMLLRKKVPAWKTEFVNMLERTELLGAVSILYGSIVLDSNSEGSSGGIKLTPELERQSILILQAINNAALLDLKMVQRSLSSELICSQFRSVMACLLTSNVPNNLKHEAILAVGYFVLSNEENQIRVTQGEQPTILQQLCMLPFRYFSDDSLKSMLFPTMISCCFRCSSARAIVEEELSLVHLAQFLTEQFPNFKQQEELINNGSDKKANLHRADRWLLSHRFSHELVGAAIKEFLPDTAQS